jgi:hypothetical protein
MRHMLLAYLFLTFSNFVVVEYGFEMLSFNNVIIIIIMNIYFLEPSSVLASMFLHFEPDNDFVSEVYYN